MDRHEFVEPSDGSTLDPSQCAHCLEGEDAFIHSDPADDLREETVDAINEAIAALVAVGEAISREGGRDSDKSNVRHFSAYHLADLQGQDGGWVGRGLLIDALRELVQ